MEFEEMKKIWDTQNNEALYGINEKALHNRILSKKKQVNHITNFSELLGILVFSGSGCFVLAMNIFKPVGNVFMYILSVWMLVTALYLLISRLRRIRADQHFDRSMHGDLAHAISVASYQVNFSRLMRWNIVPVGILTMLGVWNSGKPVWMGLVILAFFLLTIYLSGWEHNIYENTKRELEILKDKLEKEEVE